MSFIWPLMLGWLAVLPLLVVLYARLQRQRRRAMTQFGSLGVNAAAAQHAGGGARRHIPPMLFLLALTALIVALARPQAVVSLPRLGGTVILAFDVSGSMGATDIEPTRMEAAKAAARAFVEQQPATVQVGVVAFSESGLAVQTPTNDKEALIAAINRLSTARGTSLANGVLMSLKAIADFQDEPQTNFYTNSTPEATPTPTPMPQGVYAPAAIVLLTDGENTVRPDPLVAAQAAIDRGVRIHTIGVGSPEGAALKVDGFSVQTRLDEATLQLLSDATGGSYFNARSADDLQTVYTQLGSQMSIKSEATEVTALIAGGGLLLMMIGGVLSLLWFSRFP